MNTSIQVGRQVTIARGTRVTRRGVVSKRSALSVITIRRIVTTRAGNSKVFWKSNGYTASAIL